MMAIKYAFLDFPSTFTYGPCITSDCQISFGCWASKCRLSMAAPWSQASESSIAPDLCPCRYGPAGTSPQSDSQLSCSPQSISLMSSGKYFLAKEECHNVLRPFLWSVAPFRHTPVNCEDRALNKGPVPLGSGRDHRPAPKTAVSFQIDGLSKRWEIPLHKSMSPHVSIAFAAIALIPLVVFSIFW